MRRKRAEIANLALRRHVRRYRDWKFARQARDLHAWAERFIREFDLRVTTPAICVERLSRRCLGHYRFGRNGFGVSDEIAVQAEHALTSPRWQVLGTLLHELLHEWQYHLHGDAKKCTGPRNYHNAEYRAKARELGLEVDERGVTAYPEGGTPFRSLLRRHHVRTADKKVTTVISRPSKTKLGLWTCPCGVRLRVGRKEVNVRCEDCGGKFRRTA